MGREAESDLLRAHEAILLLDVDVVDGEALLGPGLVTDAAVGTPHHPTLTTGHLQKSKYLVTESPFGS